MEGRGSFNALCVATFQEVFQTVSGATRVRQNRNSRVTPGPAFRSDPGSWTRPCRALVHTHLISLLQRVQSRFPARRVQPSPFGNFHWAHCGKTRDAAVTCDPSRTSFCVCAMETESAADLFPVHAQFSSCLAVFACTNPTGGPQLTGKTKLSNVSLVAISWTGWDPKAPSCLLTSCNMKRVFLYLTHLEAFPFLCVESSNFVCQNHVPSQNSGQNISATKMVSTKLFLQETQLQEVQVI